MTYECIITRVEAEKVGVIQLNRPKALNALSAQLMIELGTALKAFDADESIGCIVLTGSEKAFAAGADITLMAKYSFADVYKNDYITRDWETIRTIRKPVIAAVSGYALGGGCELAMYCARRVAHLETYIGLVEVGVGLVPGGGGLAFGARRAAEEQAAAPDAYLLDFLKKYVLAAGTAQVSRSAIEAQAMGYLLPEDRIVFHRQELLYAAVREARAMSDAGYRPPRKSMIRVAGRSGVATVSAQMLNMRDGGFISAHDYHLGRTIAEVMCGGDVEPGSLVDEQWLMALERKAFTSLLTHPKTQERIMGMMQTGKPVRN